MELTQMPFTVHNWTPEWLSKIETDDWVATMFMNETTFSAEQIRHYPYSRRKEYLCLYDDGEGGSQDVRVYATGPDTLKAYLETQYTQMPLCVHEVKTTVTEVEL